MEAAGGNIKARYLRGINLVAQQIGNSLNYYLYNMRGDVVQYVDESSSSIHKYEYDAFGNERNPNPNDPNPFRYCGEYFDSSSDSYYLRNRYYDPSIGRFSQEDPIRSGFNWYTYCQNNPVSRVDPWGLEDVMVAYIARKNGGSVTTRTGSGANVPCGIVSSYMEGRTTIVVEINGIRREYSTEGRGAPVRQVNGEWIMDHSRLMSDFGLSEVNATHQSGDRFSSKNNAALAFALRFHHRSMNERQEYGAVIDEHDDGTFSFENVTNSIMSAARLERTFNDSLRNWVDIERNQNSVAAIHTHWHPQGNLGFTNPGDYEAGANLGVNSIFLVNRLGSVHFSQQTTARINIFGFTPGIRIFNIFGR